MKKEKSYVRENSFGLPAEQYAVETGNHPNGFTEANIKTFSAQLKELGFDYDWSKMIATSDKEYYSFPYLFVTGLRDRNLLGGCEVFRRALFEKYGS